MSAYESQRCVAVIARGMLTTCVAKVHDAFAVLFILVHAISATERVCKKVNVLFILLVATLVLLPIRPHPFPHLPLALVRFLFKVREREEVVVDC